MNIEQATTLLEKHRELEECVSDAVSKIKAVLVAAKNGQRVGRDEGLDALTVFNWLFGGYPFDKEEPALVVARNNVLAFQREACAQIAEHYEKTATEIYEGKSDNDKHKGLFDALSDQAGQIAADIRAGQVKQD